MVKPRSIGLDEDIHQEIRTLSNRLRKPMISIVRLGVKLLQVLTSDPTVESFLKSLDLREGIDEKLCIRLITLYVYSRTVPQLDEIARTVEEKLKKIERVETELEHVKKRINELGTELKKLEEEVKKDKVSEKIHTTASPVVVETLPTSEEEKELPEFMRGNEWIQIIRGKYLSKV